MRDIKFRAWDYKKMNYSPVVSDGTDGGSTSYVSLNDAVDCFDGVLMQYTGRKDKNGKEIYEGDVVRLHYFYEALGEGLGVFEAEKEIIGHISFRELGLWIEGSNEEESGYLLLFPQLHEEGLEVIGNIYENPELLKSLSK